MLIIYYANDGQMWELSYWAQCLWHLSMGWHSWEVTLQHMGVLCMMWVFNRVHGYVCVCWGCWNSIRQMDLFRVLSLLPKKGPNMFLSFANSTHHMYIHTYIYICRVHIHFAYDLLFTCFSFCFSSISYGHWWKQNAPEPLSQPQNKLERHNRAAL